MYILLASEATILKLKLYSEFTKALNPSETPLVYYPK
jgi:hypothetical protein